MANRSGNQNYLLIGLAATTAIILILSYFFFHVGERDQIWGNLFAEALMLVLAPVAWHLLFARRGILLESMQSELTDGSIVSFYPEHEAVDWSAIITSAKTIDIVVHYYGRWVRRNDKAFVDFFQHGGKLRIVMADPDIPHVLNAVRSNFFPSLTESELASKIIDTENRLRTLFDEAGSKKAELLTYYFPQALHYSFVLVDSRMLYLSVYEQFRGQNVRSSVFGIDLRKDSDLEEYWLANRRQFIDGARLGISM